MDILSTINEYVSFANILMGNPKEFISETFSEQARIIGETAYNSSMGQLLFAEVQNQNIKL